MPYVHMLSFIVKIIADAVRNCFRCTECCEWEIVILQ